MLAGLLPRWASRSGAGRGGLDLLYRRYLEQMVARGVLTIGTFRIDAAHLYFSGLYVAPLGLRVRYGLTVCGVEAEILRRAEEPALTEKFGAGTIWSFDARIPLDVPRAHDGSHGGSHGGPHAGLAVIQGHPGGAREPSVAQTFAVPLDTPVLPEPERRLRVHGVTEASSYVVQGASAAWKIRHVLDSHFGRAIGDFEAILDWGCGCGRVLQYLAGDGRPGRFHGCDVDPDNLDWCRRNIPGVAFADSAQHPPLPYAADSFDLVYGISVFSHLGPAMEEAWVAELHRVLRPGGIALMSLNIAHFQVWHQPRRFARRLAREEMIDLGANREMVEAIAEPDLYRTVVHTPPRLERVWTPLFALVDVLPGFIGGTQDLVVAQKPLRPA